MSARVTRRALDPARYHRALQAIRERRREREEELRALVGRRVRIRWPNGHERNGEVRELDDGFYRWPRIVLAEHTAPHALAHATSVEELAAGGVKAVQTAREWTSR